jgi:hypothetical protein
MLQSTILIAAVPHPDYNSAKHPTLLFTDSLMLNFSGLSAKEIEKATGYHLSFKERLALKLLHYKLKTATHKQSADKVSDEKIEKRAIWSKWLGIGSLIGLLIPGVGLLSFPAAIIAIILGVNTVDKTKHPRYSKLGITFGIVTLSLFLLAGVLVLLVTSLPVR